MQMQMQMAVDVVERQAGGAESFKLRVDFRAQLFAQAAIEKITETDADGVVGKFAARVDQAGNFFRRQRGMSAQQSQMQADAEFWIFLCQLDRFVEARFVHHQAGGGQNAFAMRADDGFVDGMRTAEIVGVDNEAAAAMRLRIVKAVHSLERSCAGRQPAQPGLENQKEFCRIRCSRIGCGPKTLNCPRSNFCSNRQ